MRIHELDLGQRARDFPLLRRVVDAGRGMMGLDLRTGHQPPEHDYTPESSSNHLCPRKVVISVKNTIPPKKSRTAVRQSITAWRLYGEARVHGGSLATWITRGRARCGT